MPKKPTLTVVSNKLNPPTSGAGQDNTGTNQQTKQTRKKSGPSRRTGGLTIKQQAFCDAVFAGNNFSEAYRQAYQAQDMSPGAIHREACVLAKHPKVSGRLEQMWAEKEQEQRMRRLSRAERVVEKLEEIGVQGKSADGTQVRALELLGKTLGLFVDRVETEDKTERDPEVIRKEIEARLARLVG
jgi:hypothetical protein